MLISHKIRETLKALSELQLEINEHIKNNKVNNIAKHLESRLINVQLSLYQSGITHYLDDVFWEESLNNEFIKIELEIIIQETEWQIQDIARHLATIN